MAGREHPLKRYRLRRGLTLEAFARELGTTKSWLSRIETGASMPSSDLIGRIIASAGGSLRANDFFPPASDARAAS